MSENKTTTTTATAINNTERPSTSITLEEPIVRGATTIETLQLLRPRTADLRGLMLADVLNMKVDAMAALLPRITTPTLAVHEVNAMAPTDLVQCALGVAAFLVPKSAKQEEEQPA